MQELSIVKNDVGGYKYNASVTLIKNINRVLEQQLFKESADGMVGLSSETPNTLTNFKSNVAIKKSDVKRQSISKAAAASSATNIIAPKITTNADAQYKAYWQNTARLTAIGVNEVIASEITVIIVAQITNPTLCTTDGSDFRTVDVYALHQLLRSVTGGAEQQSATAIRQMMVDVMAKTFDWRESATTNLERLSTAIAKVATYGVRFHNNMKGLVITANVAYTAQQTWGSELAEAQHNIRAKYLYNKVHDSESIIDMMNYLAATDKQRNRQKATAPENSKTKNMVNLGIKRLQQLVQQPPSDYASTDRDDESEMAETLDSEISAEKTRYRARECKKDNKGRHHRRRSRSLSTSLSRSPPQYRSKSCARRSVSRKPDKWDINPTNCPHCKEFGGYGLAHASPKSVPRAKCNYNKKWKGWRPEWVCKNVGVAYKDHDNCND